jgi:catechol 2,3-dioxygenase-like lactoylglutathione lyase family enzyme
VKCDRFVQDRRLAPGDHVAMKILFVAGIAIVAADPPASRKLYVDALGLPLKGENDYVHSEEVEGSKHFGVWPLSQAAQACFGSEEWPADRVVPQVSVEFEVEDEAAVADAAVELEQAGYDLLHGARKEPWGQTVTRLLSVEGSIVGISYAPALHG